MRTGPSVQMISIIVLWLVFDGTGLALSRNLTHDDDQKGENEQRDRNDEPQRILLEPARFLP